MSGCHSDSVCIAKRSVLEALMRISADVGLRVTSECSNVVWILNEVVDDEQSSLGRRKL